ncbi:MAG: hypothetical protein ABI791_07965 [Acidobacteriota bacterium]
MKNTFGKYMKISFATIALLIAAMAQTSIQAQDKAESEGNDQSADRIVGAWETTVTPVDCGTGVQISPSFQGLITFNEGGTIAEYGANPATPYRTPGHGIWSGGRQGNYSMRFSFIPLTPAGAPVGRLRVSQSMVLDRFSDISSSSGSFVLTTFGGNVIGTGCSTAVSVRLN